MANFFVATILTRMHGVSHASIITRNSFGILMSLAQQLAALTWPERKLVKRIHIEAGLLRAQGKQSFTSTASEQDAESAAGDLGGDNEDLIDFDQLSERLISGAASANGDKDVGDDGNIELLPTVPNVPAPAPLTITIPTFKLGSSLSSTYSSKGLSSP